MIKVVTGGEQHRQWLVDVAFRNMFYDEMSQPHLYCPDHLHNLLDQILPQQTIFISEKDGVPVGVLCSMLTTNMYNPNLSLLVELVWYVIPEERNSRAAILLLNRFIEVGKTVDDMVMSLLVNSPISPKTLVKKGLKMTEYGFVRGIYGL